MDLLDLLKRPEGKTLEFKRDLSSADGVLRTIVAFANTSGGTVLVGVEDRTRHVRGIAEPLDLEERLANLISDHIVPRLVPELEIIPWRRSHVLAVQVYASPVRPHYLRREGVERGAYVRVGSTNRRADRELLEELRRFARGEAYDEQPMPGLDSEALDFRVASESFAPVRRLRRADLQTLRLVTTHQGRTVPTIGGMLLFGVSREQHFPDAWIQVGRFQGVDKSRILDRAEVHGHLVGAVEEAIAFAEKHAWHGADIGRVRRRERWSVPPVAIREAVINAVVHADYAQRGAPIRLAIFDDRLEVENPGLLPFGLTLEDLPRGISRLRNRVIGRTFHALGLIEQWGSGIQRMMAACRDAGLAPPTLEEIGNRFRVTLWLEQVGAPTLDKTEGTILAILSDGTGRVTSEVAKVIGLTPRATRTRMVRLVERGLVREVGTSPQDPKR
ncbi:MAG: putative DNA binding domain-containing protein, partial [Acidobacteria bacterium]|nr:putative DNA binding domain-containing protein [Acidobacteriota bacterium]